MCSGTHRAAARRKGQGGTITEWSGDLIAWNHRTTPTILELILMIPAAMPSMPDFLELAGDNSQTAFGSEAPVLSYSFGRSASLPALNR